MKDKLEKDTPFKDGDDVKIFVDSNWEIIEKIVCRSIWRCHYYKYDTYGIEYSDFCHIAYILLLKSLGNYDPSKSSIRTHCIRVLNSKMQTYIRDNYQRDKNCTITKAERLEAPISQENATTLLIDIVPSKQIVQNPYETEDAALTKNIGLYLKQLSKEQRKVAELIMDGWNRQDIIKYLGLSEVRFGRIYARMTSDEKLAPLKELIGGQKWKNL